MRGECELVEERDSKRERKGKGKRVGVGGGKRGERFMSCNI